jgi:single-strand DNA-binding protein
LGETVAKYAKKGNKIAVNGSIELRNYEDSQGVKRTAVDIVAQDIEFLTPKTEIADSGDGTPADNLTGKQSLDDDGDIPL